MPVSFETSEIKSVAGYRLQFAKFLFCQQLVYLMRSEFSYGNSFCHVAFHSVDILPLVRSLSTEKLMGILPYKGMIEESVSPKVRGRMAKVDFFSQLIMI